VLELSGHTFNSLGFYDACIADQNLQYAVSRILVQGLDNQRGICVPKTCNLTTLETQISDLVKVIAPTATAKVVPSLKHDPIGPAFITFFVIIAVLLILVIISTIKMNMHSKSI
jgi:hypothetical protein